MTFKLGRRSRRNLEGVHPRLVDAVRYAIGITVCDFTVLEGLRTQERQETLFASGASQLNGTTKRSKHQADPHTGFAHAVDLGAWVGGSVRWEWPHYFKIAASMQVAALEHGLKVRWGGCWRVLNELDVGVQALQEAVDDYVHRKRKIGRKAFLDGPHFEIYGRLRS